MKILYITRKFPPSIGGMETQSYEFYSALTKKAKVYLISWGHSQKFLPFFLLIAIFKSLYLNLKYHIDIIQIGDLALSPLGLLLKCLFNKPTLAMAHGKDVAFNNFIYKHTIFKAVKRLDGIVCVSDFLKQKLLSKGIKADRLFINPNGIDYYRNEKLFSPDVSRKNIESKYRINLENKKILLSVSRLVRKKGITYFIQNIFPSVIKDNPDVVLLLAGEAETREAKREKSDITRIMEKYSLEKNIFYLGNIRDRKVLLREIYSIADIYIMPNQRIEGDFEGFGIVALEASLNEVPVLAFGVDGIPEAVKHGENGLLIKEGDNEGFGNAINELLRDENRRIDLGKRARKFVLANYSWDILITRYIGFLKQVKNSF